MSKTKKFVIGLAAALVLLFMVLVLAVGLVLSQGKTLGERHRPFQPVEKFDFAAATAAALTADTSLSVFSDYISWTQKRLRSARLDATAEDVIDKLSPFMLLPDQSCPLGADGKYPRGIVLTHGLFDSAYSMRNIGAYFQARCFLVVGLLLPEHGSRPGDFLTTNWREWAAAEHFAATVMAHRVENIYLGGHSVGGALSVLEAATNPAVDALILFAPALGISATARYAKFIVPLGRLFPAAAWLAVEPDNAIYRYESFTFGAAAETYALTQRLAQALAAKPLNIPVFTAASMEDNTVSTAAIVDFMAQQPDPASTMLLYSQHPLAAGPNVKVYISKAPEQGVLSLSHLGLMVAPTDPYYGRNGVYKSCGHYATREPENLRPCQAGQRDFYGEITAENLQQGVLERIAFNPFYTDLLADIDDFIARIATEAL
ncbi:MAG: alpha/beta fold hydrolase [Pseudomonadales bacterium]|nr:alpha/beta fold hydrolase [Pseudomonadales bacterium]